MPRPSTCAIPERLVDRWVCAPAGSAIPDCTLGEVHRAHHLSVLDQKTKHVRVALFAIACCAPRSDPALSVREARREARAAVLLIGILVGECVQARAIRVYPIEVGGTLPTLGQAAEEHQLAVGGELRVILAVQLPWCDLMSILRLARGV